MTKLGFAVALAAVCYGQTAPAPVKLGPITFSGNLRTRMESWDWFEGAADNAYTFSGTLLRFSFTQSKPHYDWQLELEAPILLGLPDRAIAPGVQGQLGMGATYFAANDGNRNAGMLFVKQGFFRLKSADSRHTLRAGRMEFIEGTEVVPKNPTLAALKRDRIAHRLLGNFVFTHVQRSFDGFHYAVNGSGLNFTALAARPTRGVFQVDGWGQLRSNIFYAALTGQAPHKSWAGEWRLFGVGYSDLRDGVLKTDNRPLAARRADAEHIHIGTFGGHYLHSASTGAGNVDLLFWGVLQAGSWGNLKQRSGGVAIEAGWQPRALPALRPWLRVAYNYGSGDKDPNDDRNGTFFLMLPTPRIYARFPFFNMMNTRDIFGEVILRPGPRLTIRSDVHTLRLSQRNDLWYIGGGMFQPWTFGFQGRASGGQQGLATLYDVSAEYAANRNVTVGGYFGHAAGKLLIQSIHPGDRTANLGLLELLVRF